MVIGAEPPPGTVQERMSTQPLETKPVFHSYPQTALPAGRETDQPVARALVDALSRAVSSFETD
jgi:hypothetical protein